MDKGIEELSSDASPTVDEVYHYLPVDEEDAEFRLLDILPLSDSPQAPIQCQIKHVGASTIDGIEWEAISYVWGKATERSVVLIDGRSLDIPANSEKALRRMALPDRKRTVFLDAVCINQDDLDERASQVLIMGDIYGCAEATLVYLGDADDTTARALENIRLLHLEVSTVAKAAGGYESLVRDPKTITKHPMSTHVDEEALIRLFRRPWFHRVWIVQEVVLAYKSTLMCGPEETDLAAILEVALFLLLHARQLHLELINALRNAASLSQACICTAHGGRLYLSQMLGENRKLEALDVRDKVFGALALLNQDTVSSLLTPNYAKPIPHVFRDAVRQCLTDSYLPLDIFDAISHRSEDEVTGSGFPSWVPRYDRAADLIADSMPLEIFDEAPSLGNTSLLTAAVDVPIELDMLMLPGIDLCSVLEVSRPLDSCWHGPEHKFDLKSVQAIETWYQDVTMMLKGSGISQASAARSIVADTGIDFHPISEECLEILLALLHSERDAQDDMRLTALLKSPPRADLSQTELCYVRAFVVCQHRRFAIMSNGTAGMVPEITRPSDRVVMVHGGKMPFVLRPHGQEFLMLGTCYVDQWMSWQEHGSEVEHMLLNTDPTYYRVR